MLYWVFSRTILYMMETICSTWEKSLYSRLLSIAMGDDTTEYTISVDGELWEKFKGTVTRDKTINDVIVEMIDKRVREEKK